MLVRYSPRSIAFSMLNDIIILRSVLIVCSVDYYRSDYKLLHYILCLLFMLSLFATLFSCASIFFRFVFLCVQLVLLVRFHCLGLCFSPALGLFYCSGIAFSSLHFTLRFLLCFYF